MAVSVSQVGNNTVFGDKHVKIVDLTFSGNYATNGESLTADALGFPNEVELVIFDGAAAASDGATAVPVSYDYSTNVVEFYEGSAAGTALSEKTNAEAYPTGCVVRALVIGH